MATVPDIYDYWGKAMPDATDGPSWHRLVFHSLDVAAVGSVLLDHDTGLLHRIAAASQLPVEQVRGFLPFALAIHDLGKFAPGFQGLCPNIAEMLQPGRVEGGYSTRHDSTGFWIWGDEACGACWAQGLRVCQGSQDLEAQSQRESLDPWIRAVTGHHGQPPEDGMGSLGSFPRNSRARRDAIDFAVQAQALLKPATLTLPEAVDPAQALAISSWLVAGLAIVADWLGSNQRYFPYSTADMSLAEYWSKAVQQANYAVTESGILPSAIGSGTGIQHLFPAIREPSPLQLLAMDLPLAEGPQLFILEEVTGGGKTEAALLLAHRLLQAGRGQGVFVGLPTMATANAMFARLEKAYRRLFAPGEQPSMILAHSARHLMGLGMERTVRDPDYARNESTASSMCAAWLADNRKKALLAQVGVGTVDQALLAALPVRHSALRLLGLHRNVLIVDEVHAYDHYMQRILEHVIEFQASLGGSAILMSATLPVAMRAKLCDAFLKGLQQQPRALEAEYYPLFTQVAARGIREATFRCRPGTERRVRVAFVHAADDAMATIVSATESGACACWVRNSVQDAIEGWTLLRTRLGPDRVRLFHARFMMGDRLRIEEEVCKRFGKESGPPERKGQVLVATQVVEQSLDLDFDVMVSDLAPIDLLIQRAGRLHRHPRSRSGSRTDNGDERVRPVLHVLAPEFSETPSADWVRRVLPRTANVYEHHGELWLTARVLTQRKAIVIPEEARECIELVYGEAAEFPVGLQKNADRVEGERFAQSSQGRLAALKPRRGYVRDMQWLHETRTPTRLGEPTTTLRLARCEVGAVVPLHDAAQQAWELSQVDVRSYLLDDRLRGTTTDAAVEAAERAMPDSGKWSVTLVLDQVADGCWRGHGRRTQSGEMVTVTYSPEQGLTFAQDQAG